MKKKITSICDSQTIFREQQTYKEFRKSAKEFFKAFDIKPTEETYYVVKSHIDKDGYASSFGVVYGDEQRLSLVVESKDTLDETFLAEADSPEAMLAFIKMRKNKSLKENIYIFKVRFEDYEISHVQSFYGGAHDLVLKMFPHPDLIDTETSDAIKTFGTIGLSNC